MSARVGFLDSSRLRRDPVAWVRANPMTAAGVGLALCVLLTAALASLVAPYPEDAGSATHVAEALNPPSWSHLMGTDVFGRDVLSRVLYGARISPLIAFVVIAAAIGIGLPLGVLAGYFGGIVDDVIMRITDVFLALPALLLALAFATVLPPSTTSTILAILIAWWPWYARLVRGEAASVRSRPYVESCRALGIPHWRIIVRHIVPNSVTPIIVQASLDFGGVILIAAALSFLGLGAQDPTPDWGLMVAQGQAYFLTQWWLVTFPGLAILVSSLAFNLIGEGLRDRLDPRYGRRL